MKSLAPVIRSKSALPIVRLSIAVAVWAVLLWIGTWLTPPILCNTAIEGVDCAVRMSTSRHLVEIGLASVLVTVLVAWNFSLRQTTDEPTSHRRVLATRALYSLSLLFISVYLVLAITRLVQAG
jgi:hypothetical protein